MESVYFITSIDTDAGKSVVTGALAKFLCEKGLNITTQKLVQTGCSCIADDILTHRALMGIEPTAEDLRGETCAYIFPFPASPQLAASLVGEEIELSRLIETTERLTKCYETVLVEGVGGLMVPLRRDETVLNYLSGQRYPTILVTNGKLGSVNHTLLSLEIMRLHQVDLRGVVYNRFVETDPIITNDTLALLRRRLKCYYPGAALVEFPYWSAGATLPDFSPIFA